MAKVKGGKKFRLLLYPHMINRWWPLTLTLSIILYVVVGIFWGVEWYFINPMDNPLPILPISDGTTYLFIASVSLIFTFGLLLIRKNAYVQIFPGYVRLVTPFFSFNISFKRIKNIRVAEFGSLFPPSSLSNYQKDLLDELFGYTANILELTSYPVSRRALSIFLSPYFFHDKTPHIILLLDDWMRFNTEFESFRVQGREIRPAGGYNNPAQAVMQKPQASAKKPAAPAQKRGIQSGLLDNINKKD
jgi:hypothetical protein